MQGTVVFLSHRGWGEIKPDDGGDRIKFFKHVVSGVRYPDLLGLSVTFDVEMDAGSPYGVRVRPVLRKSTAREMEEFKAGAELAVLAHRGGNTKEAEELEEFKATVARTMPSRIPGTRGANNG